MDEIVLSSKQVRALIDMPDRDMSVKDALKLRKSGEVLRRRRTVPNVFATIAGRGQPRQGFLSTEVMRAVYTRSEVVRACVDTLVELVCGLDWAIRPIDEEKSKWMRDRRPELYQEQKRRIQWLEKFFRKPNRYQSLNQFHRVVLKDLLVYDAGAYEIVPAVVGGQRLPVELGAIAGDTIEIDCDDSGFPLSYWQSYNVKQMTQFALEDVAYMMLNPVSWHPYGFSPIETAYVSITADLEANSYNASFFEKNGIPPALLAVLGLSNTEYKRLMSSMRQTSQDNPWNIHAFRAQRPVDGKDNKIFDMVPLSQVSNRDMQFMELLTHTVRRITMQYRISPSQIGFTDEVTGGIGSGVAETQVDLMESKGVAPLLRILEETHTEKVIHGTCGWDDLEFSFVQSQTPKELQERQDDMSELTSSVMTINEFRSKHGGRDAVEWGDLPLSPPQGWQPPMSPEQRQQQMMMAAQGGGIPNQPQQETGPEQLSPEPDGVPVRKSIRPKIPMPSPDRKGSPEKRIVIEL